jgi:glycosyltransferase involved in cell wall biosynthesis
VPSNDVAIYTPTAACLYERQREVTGGAERQTTLLAAGLVRSGLRVAHIVLPVEDPDPNLDGALTLVQSRLLSTKRDPVARARQFSRVWSVLAEADADVYVFRIGMPALGLGAAFCRLHRRRLVFSGSSNRDFTFESFAGRRPELALYKFGMRNTDAVVAQTEEQAELARRAFPRLPRIVELPSFAEPATAPAGAPEAFLWVGRLDDVKQPLRYVELAEAVPEARFWLVHRRPDPERSGGGPAGAGADVALEHEVYERAARIPNLEVLEQRPHAEAMELVRRAVAVVNTGPVEGMPNTFLEAWARGVPAVTYEFDPDHCITRHGLGVAAGGSPDRFREGARELWRQRDARDELSRRVRAYVEARHGVESVTRRWLSLINDLRSA